MLGKTVSSIRLKIDQLLKLDERPLSWLDCSLVPVSTQRHLKANWEREAAQEAACLRERPEGLRLRLHELKEGGIELAYYNWIASSQPVNYTKASVVCMPGLTV